MGASHEPVFRSRWWSPEPDVFVPSIPFIEDKHNEEDHDGESAEEASAFSDVSSAITWVFEVLEEHGVNLS